jgi:hypothetical protein
MPSSGPAPFAASWFIDGFASGIQKRFLHDRRRYYTVPMNAKYLARLALEQERQQSVHLTARSC